VEDGFSKIARHIKKIDPDIVGLQEVLNAKWMSDLARALGPPWEALAHSADYSDTGILTKHKFDIGRHFEVAWGTGVGVELDDGGKINFIAMHLNYHSYGPYAANNKMVTKAEQILQGEKSDDGTSRQQNIEELIRSPGFGRMLNETDTAPLILVGDFNCPSHEDWIEETKVDHGGWAFEWPATKLVVDQGLIDAFREVHPNVKEVPGNTWSTVQKWSGSEWDYSIPEPQDRIDYIYYRSTSAQSPIRPLEVELYAGDEPEKLKPIPNHRQNDYPSDHYAVYAVFERQQHH